MTIALKVVLGLGALAVGGTGTYLTYDYLSKQDQNGNKHEGREDEGQDEQPVEGVSSAQSPEEAGTCSSQETGSSCPRSELNQ